MSTMPLRDAKARLSELVEAAEAGRRTIITKHGREVAMLVPIEDGRRLYPAEPEPNFVAFLASIPSEIPLAEEDRPRIRDVSIFDDGADAAAE